MMQIPLTAIPNQSFDIILDGKRFDLTFKEANGIMAVDIAIDDVVVVTGARCVAGFPLINYQYLEQGNLFFTTMNDELPYYTEFESTQTLVYATAAEMAAARGN